MNQQKTIMDDSQEEIQAHKIKVLSFDVIQHEQTPCAPEINDISVFIKNNEELIKTFKEYAVLRMDGVGLAINQCSFDDKRVNLRIIAVKDIKTKNCTIAIDPKITKYYGIKRQKAEGCLTWGYKDGNYCVILADRNHFVDVEYYTPDGELRKETHKGFQSQIWQHEVNHINGVEEIVMMDYFHLEEPIDKKTGRNDKCPCESGKKYKHCCIE